jgi:electron transfer flavoprotein alpha subunit
MSKVLILAEHADGKLKRGTLELMSAAAGQEISLVAFGDDAAAVADEAGKYGATKLVQVTGLSDYSGEAFSAAMKQAVDQVSPDVVLTTASTLGRDVMPRLAAKLDTGFASSCTDISFDGEFSARRPVFAGKAFVKVNFLGSGPRLASVRPNVLSVNEPGSGGAAAVETIAGDAGSARTKLLERTTGKSDRPDLTEAGIIVSGGRAMESEDNFGMLFELADVMGGTVGASRAAVDAGYAPHSMQVGQTGKVVNPQLYFAIGISGAIQHLAGMRTSKVIVAVNKDPEAPIFQVATYGIVADLYDFVPKFTAACKEMLAH